MRCPRDRVNSYYEQLGLLPEPQRTAAGYRAYDESVLGRLAFIARAKTLGCSLEEIAELMPHWDGGRCAPVQDRLRELVMAKLSDAQARVAELEAFTADLGNHIPDGPCDSDCGCLTDSSTTSTPGPPVASVSAPPVACTLDAAEIQVRLQEWRDVVTHAVDRSTIEGGTRLQLDATTPLDQLVLLVTAEQCCSFFALPSPWTVGGLALEVQAPPKGQAMLDSFGATPAARRRVSA